MLACAITLAARPSTAEPEPTPKTQAPSAEEEARKLYAEGVKHYDVAEYQEAIASFRKAYFLVNAPELLFDIAQSYRMRGPGSCRSALQFYRSYLRVDPKTPRRANVETSIAEMEACAKNEPAPNTGDDGPAGSSEAPAQPAPPARPEPPTRAEPTPTLPIVVGASGLGLSLIGGGLFVWSRLRYDALSDSCSPDCDPQRLDAPAAAQTAGGVLIGVGAAVLVSGAVLWLLRPRATNASASPFWSPAKGALTF